jgi:hypothetical protein
VSVVVVPGLVVSVVPVVPGSGVPQAAKARAKLHIKRIFFIVVDLK